MSDATAQEPHYMVSIHEPEEAGGSLVFSFVPKGPPQERGPGGIPKRLPQFVVVARTNGEGLAFDWSATPDDPGAAREELQTEAAVRMKERSLWIGRVSALVDQVEQWVKEMGWATRRIDKKLDDPDIGKHRVPALLMQEDTCRVILEPVGRASFDVEGMVDLYLMPAYDDIARLFYYHNRWNLHPMFPGIEAASTHEVKDVPLSKETLEKVLVKMKQHAA